MVNWTTIYILILHAYVLASSEAPHTSPILPFELLVALHQIPPEECELKTVMNGTFFLCEKEFIIRKFFLPATTLCFNERAIYTHNVLAIVIQQLVDINPIPVLFMRTVLQALSFYPKMVGFVMNILQRLITKQVNLTKISFEYWWVCFSGMETSANLGRFHKMLSKNSPTLISITYPTTSPTVKTCFANSTWTTRRSHTSHTFDVRTTSKNVSETVICNRFIIGVLAFVHSIIDPIGYWG